MEGTRIGASGLRPTGRPLALRDALIACAVLVPAALVARSLAGIALTERTLPLWDPAAHGMAGLELARHLGNLDLPGFLLALNRQVTWPPVHALMLAPAFLLLGARPIVGDLVSAALWLVTAAALFWAGTRLHASRGAWTGAAAALLFILSPLHRGFGTVTMLEIPGAFLLAMAIALQARALEEGAAEPAALAAALAAAALFLCKYNYGLLWIAPLLLFHFGLHTRAGLGAALAGAGAYLRAGTWRRPFPLLVAAAALGLLAVLVTGGGAFSLAGHRIAFHSPGNGAYALGILVLARAGLAWRRDREAWRRQWNAWPGPRRMLALGLGLPLGAWMAIPYPNRVKALFDFVANRSDAPAAWTDRLLFYPRAFLEEHTPTPALGLAVLALALVPPLARPPRRFATLLYVALLVGLAAAAFHRYQQARFLATIALLIWLRAADTAVALLERAVARLRPPAPVREAFWLVALLAALAGALVAGPPLSDTRLRHHALGTDPAFAPVVDEVLAQARRAPAPRRLLGSGNRLSPALLAWRAAPEGSGAGDDALPRRLPSLAADAPERAIEQRLGTLLRERASVIVALPEPGSPLYGEEDLSEVRADSMTAVRLLATPDVRVERDARFAGAGFRVRTLRFLDR